MKYVSLIPLLILVFFSCRQEYEETHIELDNYHIKEGLNLAAVASEPLIEAPVDISFDPEGNLWVLEMRGYMRSVSGANEEDPVGRIVILEDRDEDGNADHYRVFLDSLVLARAFAHVYGGLLYAEPPNLWFVEIGENLAPGPRVLVDSAYAVGGNVEHQPNGLMMNIDNWIYSAKGTKRYRRLKDEWLIENTPFRGQWGISRDEYGRLVYNDNSNQLRGDYVIPGILQSDNNYHPSSLSGQNIVKDQRVYPMRATPINRGYIDGVLDEEEKLVNVTSACGPVIYYGTSLGESYHGDAFVCVPEANLVKRNILNHGSLKFTGLQAYKGSEFLVSTDLGFRPVNLKNGPDGALYIVDMHRGIIQHKTYMTSYLRDKLIESGLDSLTGMGRILRISREGGGYQAVSMDHLELDQVIDSLSSNNIWIRDRAQQIIIEKGDRNLLEKLIGVLNTPGKNVSRIHALYCLEGLDVLEDTNIQHWDDYPQLMTHLVYLTAEGKLRLPLEEFEPTDSLSSLYWSYFKIKNGDVQRASEASIPEFVLRDLVLTHYKGNPEQIIPEGVKEAFVKFTQTPRVQSGIEYRGLTPGRQLYVKNCAVCHGNDGQGLPGLAPPLLESEYVSGNPEQLANILLYGLEGPVTVAGKSYEFNNAMPGLVSNPEMSDEDIRYIMNYIRNAFATAGIVPPSDLVSDIRKSGREPGKVFTENELNSLYEN